VTRAEPAQAAEITQSAQWNGSCERGMARPGAAHLVRSLLPSFHIDALRCPHCAGRLRLITAVHDPTAIQAILAAVHVADAQMQEQWARTTTRGPPGPARRSAA
jgi:hypothetical protein